MGSGGRRFHWSAGDSFSRASTSRAAGRRRAARGSGRRGVLPEHKQLHPRSRLSFLYSPLSRLGCSLSCTSPQSGHRQPCVHVANVTWIIPFLRVLSLLQESRVLRNCALHVCLLSVSCLLHARFTIFLTPQRALLSAAPATPRINGRSPPRCAHAVPKHPGVDSRFSVRVSSGLHWFRIDCAPRAQTPSATSHPPRPLLPSPLPILLQMQ